MNIQSYIQRLGTQGNQTPNTGMAQPMPVQAQPMPYQPQPMPAQPPRPIKGQELNGIPPAPYPTQPPIMNNAGMYGQPQMYTGGSPTFNEYATGAGLSNTIGQPPMGSNPPPMSSYTGMPYGRGKGGQTPAQQPPQMGSYRSGYDSQEPQFENNLGSGYQPQQQPYDFMQTFNGGQSSAPMSNGLTQPTQNGYGAQQQGGGGKGGTQQQQPSRGKGG